MIAGAAAAAATVAGCALSSVYGGPPTDGGDDDSGPTTFDAAYGGWPFDAPYDTGVDAKEAGNNEAATEAGPSDAGVKE